MNDTAIVTCFYTNLHGTEFGGRSHKEHQYLMSFASLLKINNADFYVYCDPKQRSMLRDFVQSLDLNNNVTIISFDLSDFYMKDLFDQYKDVSEAKTSQRCQEIQYLKTYWLKQVSDRHEYEWLFWIDIGISYSNLIPYKHMVPKEHGFEYYNSTLFCNNLITGMKAFSENKLLLLCINNNIPVFYRQCIEEYFNRFQNEIEYHVIAGIFGGRKESVVEFHKEFFKLAVDVTLSKKVVYDEECLYNILWDKNPEKYAAQKFETWWHEDNAASHKPNDHDWVNYIKAIRSFYNVLEDFIKLGKENNHDQEETQPGRSQNIHQQSDTRNQGIYWWRLGEISD